LAADRRYVRVRSTAKGRRVMDRARARRLSEMATQLEQLDDEQIAALSAAIDVLELIERERTA
jgi:DNA-binding MarR family transcriptional regulator